tara:strand:+ start:1663 stop:3132 length:1470 start_codon:yes stop_codon:yes gene_type:complete
LTNFDFFIDGPIVLIYFCIIFFIGIWLRKYVSNVEHFLVANRGVDVYLGIASLAATEFGIATCMANAELGFKYGLKGIIPGIALGGSMLIVGLTGFCIEPLRNMAVITIPELFERKFGKKIRWASGLVILIGGLLNMGLFLRQAGNFLSITMGIGEGYLELLMTVILLFVGCYTVIGGMVSVLVTDYIQFILMCLGLASITIVLVYQFGWQSILDQSTAYLGPDSLNLKLNAVYTLDRLILDILVAFASVLTWQTIISRVLSAKDSSTAKKIYRATSPYMLMRFVIPVFLGISALYYFGPQSYGNGKEILAMPNMIAQLIPVGLIGVIIAGMLAADMSTNSSYLIAWSSVIYNDLLAPIHKNKWSSKKGLFYNRMIICCIGVFLLLYGLWYPLSDDLWVYMQVTGTIYLSSMSVLLIACCYFKDASAFGAGISIIIGALIPVSYLFLQDLSFSSTLVKNIGPYRFGVLSFLLSALGMFIGSLITKFKSK